MPAAMTAKGKVKPTVTFIMGGNEEAHMGLQWDRGACDLPDRLGSKVYTIVKGVGVQEKIDNADAIIAGLPSIEEARMAEFTNLLAQTIEMGKAHGIDVQFVNPLTEAMKRLSENALTHQPERA